MENSILLSTKDVLNIETGQTVFDEQVLIAINAAFSVRDDRGVIYGVVVSDETATWSGLGLEDHVTNMVKTYVNLKARMLFDPPTTSYLVDAMEEQIREFEIRLSLKREWALDPVDPLLGS